MQDKQYKLATLCETHRSAQLPNVNEHAKLTFTLDEPVMFRGNPVQTESMWVRVTEINVVDGVTVYTGYIDNDPVVITELEYTDVVHFTAQNIKQVINTSATH